MANLLSPLSVNGLELKNRIVMPPMATRMSTPEGLLTEEAIQHYVERAEEVGLIVVEHAYIAPEGRFREKQLGIYSDKLMEPLKKLVQEVHKKGAKIGFQLTHAGSRAKTEIIGELPVGPSPVVHPLAEVCPVELTMDDMARLLDLYAAAAERVKKCGFDMVEIHGAHGYLLGQFISPLTNKRQDEYGGNTQSRAKFPVQVVQAVRKQLGKDYPLFYRLGADDRLPGGLTSDEAAVIAGYLAEAGIDCLDLSGNHCQYLSDNKEQGYFVYLADKIRPAVGVPLLVTGGITEAEFADDLVREEKADLVGVGRALLKDAAWARKAVKDLAGDMVE